MHMVATPLALTRVRGYLQRSTEIRPGRFIGVISIIKSMTKFCSGLNRVTEITRWLYERGGCKAGPKSRIKTCFFYVGTPRKPHDLIFWILFQIHFRKR